MTERIGKGALDQNRPPKWTPLSRATKAESYGHPCTHFRSLLLADHDFRKSRTVFLSEA